MVIHWEFDKKQTKLNINPTRIDKTSTSFPAPPPPTAVSVSPTAKPLPTSPITVPPSHVYSPQKFAIYSNFTLKTALVKSPQRDRVVDRRWPRISLPNDGDSLTIRTGAKMTNDQSMQRTCQKVDEFMAFSQFAGSR